MDEIIKAKTSGMEDLSDIVLRRVHYERLNNATRVRSGLMNPSSFGKCYRRQYWERMNEPDSDILDDETLLRFKLGDIVETYILELISDREAFKKVKVLWNDVSGEIDIEWPIYIEDIKTVDGSRWSYIKKSDEAQIAKDKLNYVLQLMTYVVIKGKDYGKLTFFEKNGFISKSFWFFRKEWEPAVNSEIETNRSWWAKKELPPQVPRLYVKDGKSKECQYCQFRSKCQPF